MLVWSAQSGGSPGFFNHPQSLSTLPPGRVPNWPEHPKEASVVPFRPGEHSEAVGFLVAGIHPGHAFGEAYSQFVRRVAEQITIGLASARAYEQERQRAEALAERGC